MLHFVYALYAAAVINGLTAVVGVIIAYLKRPEAEDTWLASHYVWQIRTFWWAVLFMAIGAVTTFVMIGFVVMFAAGIWFIYRIVKGWLRLGQMRAVENPTALL